MLTVRMPDNGKKKTSPTRVLWEAIGYVVAAGLILTSVIIAYDSAWWWVPVVVEVWWFWAAMTKDWDT